MSTKETRAWLTKKVAEKRAAAMDAADKVQIAIAPQEVQALLAEYCPPSLVELKNGLGKGGLPTHVVLFLHQIDEVLAGAPKKEDDKSS